MRRQGSAAQLVGAGRNGCAVEPPIVTYAFSSSGQRLNAGSYRRGAPPRPQSLSGFHSHCAVASLRRVGGRGSAAQAVILARSPVARLDNRRGHACRRIELCQNCTQHHVPAKFADAAKAVHVLPLREWLSVRPTQPRNPRHDVPRP
jgi:hypothetical protein